MEPFQFVICSILDFSEALCSIVWRHHGKWRTLKLFRKLSTTTKLWRKKYFSPFQQNSREDKKRNRFRDTQKLQNPRWTQNKQDPVSTMQKTGLANHSSFLVWSGKGYHLSPLSNFAFSVLISVRTLGTRS